MVFKLNILWLRGYFIGKGFEARFQWAYVNLSFSSTCNFVKCIFQNTKRNRKDGRELVDQFWFIEEKTNYALLWKLRRSYQLFLRYYLNCPPWSLLKQCINFKSRKKKDRPLAIPVILCVQAFIDLIHTEWKDGEKAINAVVGACDYKILIQIMDYCRFEKIIKIGDGSEW